MAVYVGIFRIKRFINSKPLLGFFRALKMVYKIIYQNNYIPDNIHWVYYLSIIFLIFTYIDVNIPIGSINKELKDEISH